VILHGSEAVPFTSSGYDANRELVDRAARLDAYRLIDVRICETWMTENGIERSEIPAFVEPVPYAPEEIERLQAEGYAPRDSVNL
jgi:intracellular sulfur oxidation DsrE/DsrF family protein